MKNFKGLSTVRWLLLLLLIILIGAIAWHLNNQQNNTLTDTVDNEVVENVQNDDENTTNENQDENNENEEDENTEDPNEDPANPDPDSEETVPEYERDPDASILEIKDPMIQVENPDLLDKIKVICLPDCDGKTCGDNGCDGICGTCSTGQVCQSNICRTLVKTIDPLMEEELIMIDPTPKAEEIVIPMPRI